MSRFIAWPRRLSQSRVEGVAKSLADQVVYRDRYKDLDAGPHSQPLIAGWQFLSLL